MELKRTCCSDMEDAFGTYEGALIIPNPEYKGIGDPCLLALKGKHTYAPIRYCPFCGLTVSARVSIGGDED